MNELNIAGLVDNKTGRQSRLIFHEQQIYELEQERLFGRCWLFLAHECQLPEAGDYIRTFMGEDEVIVVRQKDKSVKAFLNSCTHRGNRVCKADQGNTRSFVCSYHGWSFGSDGSLMGVPLEEEAYHNQLDKSKFGLRPVARVASYKGLVFGNFDPEAPTLEDYLGDIKFYLDVWLDAVPGGGELIGTAQKIEYPVNWKMPVENVCGDGYHAGWAHASIVNTIAQSIDVGITAGNTQFDDSSSASVAGMNGHSVLAMLDGYSGYAFYPEPSKAIAYLDANRQAAIDRLGDYRGNNLWGSNQNITVFPNMQVLPGLNWLRVYHPRGPGKIEMWTWAVVEKGMPDDLKQMILDNVCRTFGGAGMFDNDDGDNFGATTTLNNGWQTRHGDVYCNMSIDVEKEHSRDEMPGVISKGLVCEQNQRYFYRRWQEVMSAESWADIPDYNGLEEARATEKV
jgi:3-phenylpropionate/trans-cinnamate dioxygenase alpha subunit